MKPASIAIVAVLGLAVLVGAFAIRGPGVQADELDLVVHREATCDCCGAYEQYARGYHAVHDVVEGDVNAYKDSLGVPANMRSCHTATIEGYFVKGHVPAAAIAKLLDERPDIAGIALPRHAARQPGHAREPAADDRVRDRTRRFDLAVHGDQLRRSPASRAHMQVKHL